jgi:hypothetical protein
MQTLDELFKSINIYHITEKINNPYEALSIMVDNTYEAVSFEYQIDFFINNISILEIDNVTKKYVYKYELNGLFDIITNIESNIPIEVLFGSSVNDNKDLEFVKFMSPYSTAYIVFYIDPDSTVDVYVKMKCYLLSNKIRDNMMQKSISTKTHKYVEGVSVPLSNFV